MKELIVVVMVSSVPTILGLVLDLQVTPLSLIWQSLAIFSIIMWQTESYKSGR